MFDVQNSINLETAKSYFIEDSHDLYYDTDNYSRIVAFDNLDEKLSDSLDTLFGGDWICLGKSDIEMLDKHYEDLDRINVLSDLLTYHSYQSDLVLTTFPERLRMFLSGFSDLINAKNKAYGNSALEPISVFSKATSSDVIMQQIDHKLSRVKNSDTPSKNDVIDLMGYLTLYCLDQSWLYLQDLHE